MPGARLGSIDVTSSLPEQVRCAARSLARGDQLAGSASTVRRFLLVEHPGPWGEKAMRDAAMSDAVRAHLDVPGTRTLLMRRHGRRTPGPTRVLLADVRRRLLVGAEVPTPDDVTSLAVDDADADCWTPAEPILGVCTHGRHDACCATLGRPVAAEAATLDPEGTWEVSHLGGDRFAGNAVLLPEGLYLGRVEPEHVAGLLALRGEGRLDLDRLRGRTDLPMPAQYAEIHLRRSLGLDGLNDVAYVGRDGEDGWVFEALGERHVLRIARTLGEPDRLTCRAAADSRPPTFRVLDPA